MASLILPSPVIENVEVCADCGQRVTDTDHTRYDVNCKPWCANCWEWSTGANNGFDPSGEFTWDVDGGDE